MKFNLKESLIKASIYKFFISLPFLFFMTFLFFHNFIRSIEFTLTMFFTTYIIMIGYEYIYRSKWKIVGITLWFIIFISACIILKVYSK